MRTRQVRQAIDPAERERRKRARAYIWKATGFASCGWWPTYRHSPHMTMPRQPEPPPPLTPLTADEAATVNKWLGQRGWALIQAQGVWKPVRTI
jgi:hypothetical protein